MQTNQAAYWMVVLSLTMLLPGCQSKPSVKTTPSDSETGGPSEVLPLSPYQPLADLYLAKRRSELKFDSYYLDLAKALALRNGENGDEFLRVNLASDFGNAGGMTTLYRLGKNEPPQELGRLDVQQVYFWKTGPREAKLISIHTPPGLLPGDEVTHVVHEYLVDVKGVHRLGKKAYAMGKKKSAQEFTAYQTRLPKEKMQDYSCRLAREQQFQCRVREGFSP